MAAFWFLLAIVWGALLACFLQYTALGRFLALRRTWITVVIGVGVDLLIALGLALTAPWSPPLGQWLQTTIIIVLSSLPIIWRSIHNELEETRGMISHARGDHGPG